MNFTDCKKWMASERQMIFGKAFATVPVTGYAFQDGIVYTKVILEGKEVVLVGDPEAALHSYLLSGGKDNVKGSA